MTDPGLSTVQHVPPTADATVQEPPLSPVATWQAIASDDDVLDALARALTATVSELDAVDRVSLLERLDVDLAGDWSDDETAETWASMAVDAATCDTSLPHGELPRIRWLRMTRELGGQTNAGPRSSREDLRLPLRLLDAGDETPTVVLGLPDGWSDAERSQREAWLSLVLDVADVADVRLATTGLERRRLVDRHEAALPTSLVNEVRNQRHSGGSTSERVRERARAAREGLADDHPAWYVLWSIADTAAERRSYAEIYHDARLNDVGKDSQRHRIRSLREYDLVEPVNINGDMHARLLPEGEAALAMWRQDREASVTWPAETTETDAPDRTEDSQGPTDGLSTGESAQSDGSDSSAGAVNDPPKTTESAVGSRERAREGGESAEGRPATEAAAGTAGGSSTPAPATDFLAEHEHHAIASAAHAGDFVLCDRPVEHEDDERAGRWSFDEDRGEVVVETTASPTMAATMTRVATTLLSDPALAQALTSTNLAGSLEDVGLEGLADGNPVILRRARCLGWLRNVDMNAASFRDRLTSARRDLLAQLGDVLDGGDDVDDDLADDLDDVERDEDLAEEDDETVSLSTVLRRAHGLVGAALHVYDLLGLEVTVDVQIPDLEEWDADLLDDLATTLSKAGSIASRYGHYPTERVQFDPRPEKREDILGTPDVGEDAVGESIATWVVEGRNAERLEPSLTDALAAGSGEVQRDGESWAPWRVDWTVATPYSRPRVVEVLNRVLGSKSLLPTSAWVSAAHGLLGSLRDVAAAANALGAADDRRRVRLAELRRALTVGVDDDRILPSTSGRSDGALVAALLDADAALSTSELAGRAGVSTQTVRNRRDALEAVGLLDVETDGAGRATYHRIRLPRSEERHDADAPRPRFLATDVDDDLAGSTWGETSRRLSAEPGVEAGPGDDALRFVVDEVELAVDVDLPASWRSPETGLRDWPALFKSPDVVPFGGLFTLADRLLGEELGAARPRSWGRRPSSTTVAMGARPRRRQSSLAEHASGDTAASAD